MGVPDDLKTLLSAVPSPPDEPLPSGISDQELADLTAAMGRRVPEEVVEWLRYTNGPCVGPGGVFGVGTSRRGLDILAVLGLYAGWSDNGWLPVAGDGSGNFYVLDLAERASGKTPVYFIDVHEDPDSPAYVVASGFWLFLEFLLRKELGHTGWPFSKSDVLARDPEIASVGTAPLPWE